MHTATAVAAAAKRPCCLLTALRTREWREIAAKSVLKMHAKNLVKLNPLDMYDCVCAHCTRRLNVQPQTYSRTCTLPYTCIYTLCLMMAKSGWICMGHSRTEFECLLDVAQQPFCVCGVASPQERDKIYTFNASNDFDD